MVLHPTRLTPCLVSYWRYKPNPKEKRSRSVSNRTHLLFPILLLGKQCDILLENLPAMQSSSYLENIKMIFVLLCLAGQAAVVHANTMLHLYSADRY